MSQYGCFAYSSCKCFEIFGLVLVAPDKCNIFCRFVLLETSAKQRLDWLLQTGELYLSSRPQGRLDKERAEKLLAEHEEFKQKAKVRDRFFL